MSFPNLSWKIESFLSSEVVVVQLSNCSSSAMYVFAACQSLLDCLDAIV